MFMCSLAQVSASASLIVHVPFPALKVMFPEAFCAWPGGFDHVSLLELETHILLMASAYLPLIWTSCLTFHNLEVSLRLVFSQGVDFCCFVLSTRHISPPSVEEIALLLGFVLTLLFPTRGKGTKPRIYAQKNSSSLFNDFSRSRQLNLERA